VNEPSRWPIAFERRRGVRRSYSPVPAGDYALANHVFTDRRVGEVDGGSRSGGLHEDGHRPARHERGLDRLAPTIEALAELEDMPAHKITARR